MQRDVVDREAVSPRPTFGTGLGMDPGETRTWELVADRRDASVQTDFELSLELAVEREETLRTEIEAEPDGPTNEQIERLMRLYALRLMAGRR